MSPKKKTYAIQKTVFFGIILAVVAMIFLMFFILSANRLSHIGSFELSLENKKSAILSLAYSASVLSFENRSMISEYLKSTDGLWDAFSPEEKSTVISSLNKSSRSKF